MQFNGKEIGSPIKHLDIFLNKIGEIQKKGYESIIEKIYDNLDDKKQELFSNMDSFGYNDLKDPMSALNICYEVQEGENKRFFTGREGLSRVMTNEYNTETKLYSNFQYNEDERIFSYDNIGKYSAKIKSILSMIQKSKGIILIYSQYLDGGLVPMALALEEMGFSRLKSKNLLKKTSETLLMDSTTMKQTRDPVKKAKYCMITGTEGYSPNNYSEIELVNNSNNKNGEMCKVVLISQAGSEGIDFKCLRQVHIMEPWYNLNRIEQITGRAIRNCSHKTLPLSERNCQVFLHGTYVPNEPEFTDMMVYRYAEAKAEKIGIVQKVLKSVSIDCILNHSQKNFSKLLNQNIDIKLSTGETINYNIRDKPHTAICDYSDKCDYKCINTVNSSEQIDKTSYSYDHVQDQDIVVRLKKMFLEKNFYKISEIYSKFAKSVPQEKIDNAINLMTNNSSYTLIDSLMRKGRLFHVDEYIIFKPDVLTSGTRSLYDLKRPIKDIINGLNISTKKVEEQPKSEIKQDKTTNKKRSMKEILQEKKKNKEKSKSDKLNTILSKMNKVFDVLNNDGNDVSVSFYINS